MENGYAKIYLESKSPEVVPRYAIIDRTGKILFSIEESFLDSESNWYNVSTTDEKSSTINAESYTIINKANSTINGEYSDGYFLLEAEAGKSSRTYFLFDVDGNIIYKYRYENPQYTHKIESIGKGCFKLYSSEYDKDDKAILISGKNKGEYSYKESDENTKYEYYSKKALGDGYVIAWKSVSNFSEREDSVVVFDYTGQEHSIKYSPSESSIEYMGNDVIMWKEEVSLTEKKQCFYNIKTDEYFEEEQDVTFSTYMLSSSSPNELFTRKYNDDGYLTGYVNKNNHFIVYKYDAHGKRQTVIDTDLGDSYSWVKMHSANSKGIMLHCYNDRLGIPVYLYINFTTKSITNITQKYDNEINDIEISSDYICIHLKGKDDYVYTTIIDVYGNEIIAPTREIYYLMGKLIRKANTWNVHMNQINELYNNENKLIYSEENHEKIYHYTNGFYTLSTNYLKPDGSYLFKENQQFDAKLNAL